VLRLIILNCLRFSRIVYFLIKEFPSCLPIFSVNFFWEISSHSITITLENYRMFSSLVSLTNAWCNTISIILSVILSTIFKPWLIISDDRNKIFNKKLIDNIIL
jgi:hypothetical protein